MRSQRFNQRYPRFATFVRNRLSPESYLGLHLTIGLLLSLAALGIFSLIAEDVVGREELTQIDLTVANTLHGDATPTGVAIFKAITTLGNVGTMVALGIGVVLVLAAKKRWLLVGGWLLAQAGGGLLNEGLKLLFKRPRPSFTDPFVHLESWSFPSGHAMGSLIGYGLLAYLLVITFKRRPLRVVIVALAVSLVLLVGFSRMYLGAHYLSDVVAGFAAGSMWLGACISGLEVARGRKHQERMVQAGTRSQRSV